MTLDHAPPTSPVVTDLAAIEQRQAKLYEALAEVQSPHEDPVAPGAAGLALFHRVALEDAGYALEAVLVHAHGGEITSGRIPLDSFDPQVVQAAQQLTGALLLVDFGLAPLSATPQTERPPLPLQQDAAVDSGRPERRTDSPAQDTPAEPPAAADPEPPAPKVGPEPVAADPDSEPPAGAPTRDEVAAIIARCDALVKEKPQALRLITTTFRTHFGLPKTVPFAKALATATPDAIAWVKAELAKEGA